MAITIHPNGLVTGGTIRSTGNVVQVVQQIKTDTQDFGSISQGAETSIPFVASIVPSSASNKILVQMMITMDMNTTHGTFATAKKPLVAQQQNLR